MICERFSFIIICSILSNLTIDSSWATTSNVTEANLVENIAVLTSNQNSLGQKNQIAQNKSIGQSESQPDLSSNSSDTGSSSKINRSWFLVAMMVTFSIYLFLLWNLFRKPLPSKVVANSSSGAEDQLGRQDIIVDKNRAELVKQEQIGLSRVSDTRLIAEETDDLPQDEPAIVNSNNSDRSKISMVENISPSGNLVKINSGNNSDHNYIDVGLELIQDLSSCDRIIRRKAIWELAKFGDSRCIEPLMIIMPQAMAVDKSLIIKAVTQITNRSFESINEHLCAELHDPNPQVRINAILELTDFYKFVIPINQQLSQMQLDSEPEVKYRAKQALEKLNLVNFPEPSFLVNDYSSNLNGNVNGSLNGNLTSEDKGKANQV